MSELATSEIADFFDERMKKYTIAPTIESTAIALNPATTVNDEVSFTAIVSTTT